MRLFRTRIETLSFVLGAVVLASSSEPLAAAQPRAERPGHAALAQDMDELEELIAEERAEARRLLQRGSLSAARGILRELLDELPDDAATRTLLAQCRWGTDDPVEVLRDAQRAFDDALKVPAAAEVLGTCARNLATMLTEVGRAEEALEVLSRAGGALQPTRDPRDAWVLGVARLEAGQAPSARAAFELGAGTGAGEDWEQLLARGRCERQLERFTAASVSLVRADRAAGGSQPDVLVELGDLYFQVDGEVEDGGTPEERLPGVKYKQALAVNKTHRGALLGLFELARFNWRRQSRSSGELLGDLLDAHPNSIDGLTAAAVQALDNGHLPRARHFLEQLKAMAPERRAVRSEQAALAWVEHRQEEARKILARLAEQDPSDPLPELAVGKHLLELYRFTEALPFLESAAKRAPGNPDVLTQLGRALANSGDEERGLAMLERAEAAAAGRRNAWRHNMRLVLQRLATRYTETEADSHTLVWEPRAASILDQYVTPFYADAREELAERYGFTPGDVRIEFFGVHNDFSVRSTGFRGFPALGVCFGPVVTAVSPLAEMRGSFSWARTAYHEYTHVIHLGLSHNRCPRWITEGLATWEEGRRNGAWMRNMRQDLVDARANDNLIPVRELNAAFRGERILFGYYEGGLLVEMLVRDHGFSPMIRLLEAFDRGLDLDQAFDEVFDLTPEEVDRRLEVFVDEKLAGLNIEPRWSPRFTAAKRFELGREAPEDPQAQREWAEGWCTIAWGAWQARRRVDAEEALRRIENLGVELPRASFLRAEIGLARGEIDAARELYLEGLAAGGEDFRARMVLGSILADAGEGEKAEEHLLAAEKAFPGFPQLELSAELALVKLYGDLGRPDRAMEARERWLRYNAGEFIVRMQVADWHLENERFAEACFLYAEANEVDPFHTGLHLRWGQAAGYLEDWEVAVRELGVALDVPEEHDSDPNVPLQDSVRANTLGRRAKALRALDRVEEARADAEAALELDAECAPALEALEGLS